MRTFDIKAPDTGMLAAIDDKIDNLNKPKGSLGRLEDLCRQICLAGQTLEPSVARPCHLLFGADHGIEREGVSASPREITWQQMRNFADGGAAINMFCRQHGFTLRIVDVGVDHDLSDVPAILNRKIMPHGTHNFLHEAAMSAEEFDRALDTGAALADDCFDDGCRLLTVGEMGIGNTSASSLWMSMLCHIPLAECTGAGSGLAPEGVRHKTAVLQQAADRFLSAYRARQDHRARQAPEGAGQGPGRYDTVDVLREFGGLEMAAALGAMLRAAERRRIVVVDGFIMTACALAALTLYPAARGYMIFAHQGDESGHARLLQQLGARPLLNLGLRLGEGTGAVCAFPLIDSAVRMINEMNNFKNAHITKFF